jgi:hypothetical protein
MARKPTDEVQLKLRFSEALRRRLERAAARNHRSMNTEIIHRLDWSFGYEAGSAEAVRQMRKRAEETVPEMREKLDKIIDRIVALEAEEPKDAGEKK